MNIYGENEIPPFEPFNLSFPLKEGNNNQDGRRVIEVQRFIHNLAILLLRREMQFIQFTELSYLRGWIKEY